MMNDVDIDTDICLIHLLRLLRRLRLSRHLRRLRPFLKTTLTLANIEGNY